METTFFLPFEHFVMLLTLSQKQGLSFADGTTGPI